ncbi:hypothetical protein TIFTF001_029610 [Ficus carica]|uniref:5'-3' exonuclease domain-containing protein n=1 Tax=Ficus carica TaxID=3494 RepID=A0AA88J1Q7_FICCA|nr:hypothetical protein TIFTF001_029610 [Ficus carica]
MGDIDGERGSEHRRQLLPSYKAHRWKFLKKFSQGHVGRAHGVIADVLGKCNVPVLRFDGHETDDVVATLAEQALQKGHKVVVASPDKDFKQLLSEDCILGDEADGVPGIQHVAPGFGRKTALKLLKKHGSLEELLSAAAVRTVGKQYAQEALVEHAEYLRRNDQVLALRRDVNVQLQEEWLVERVGKNDSVILSNFLKTLEETKKFGHHNGHTLRKG